MEALVYCPKCGKELTEKATFCDRCGQRLGESRSTPFFEDRISKRIEKTLDRHGPDYLDGIGFGVFLIAAAWTFLQFPLVFDDLLFWMRTWRNGLTMLPMVLIEPLVLFFIIMGSWGIIEGAIRITSGRIAKGIGNIVSGLGSLALAYLFRSYGNGIIAETAIIPSLVIIIGASVVLSSIFNSIIDR